MKPFVSKNRKWFGYLLFALVLTVALLYFRFPSDAMRDYVQTKGDRASPRLAISVERIEPSITIGLKFRKTEVALKVIPDRVLLRADHLLLQPELWSLLRGRSKYSFHCGAYKGDVSGSVYFDKDRAMGFIDTEMALSDIRIGDYPYLAHLIGRPLEGALGGTISFSGQYNRILDGSGEANLRLSDGRIQLLQPFLTLKSIDFSEMEIDLALRDQKINLSRLELKGEQLRGTLSGTIALKKEFAKSRLDLKGTIEPFAALFKSTAGMQDTVALFRERLNEGGLSFVIRGTVKEPIIKFT